MQVRSLGPIPGSGRSLGGGHGNPLQYSCLENSIDSGAWQTTDGRIARRSNLAYMHIWQAYGSFLCGFRKWYHTCYLTSVG